ncbi:hypothetical protein Bca52824_096406, partial [Brassica carinata]
MNHIKDLSCMHTCRERQSTTTSLGRDGGDGKLRMFVAQEPVVAASCLIGGVGLFLPAVVRPILDSLEASKQVKAPPLTH